MTRRLITLALLLAATLLCLPWAHAQTVYRCGSSYSQQPCPDAKPVDVSDSRSREQKAQSDAAVRHDKQAADSLEKSRLKQEELAARSQSAGNSASGPHKRAAAPEPPNSAQRKHKKPEYFTARNPPPDKKAKKTPPDKPQHRP
jgi:hypothetical protein